jgi:hypothetical protein
MKGDGTTARGGIKGKFIKIGHRDRDYWQQLSQERS